MDKIYVARQLVRSIEKHFKFYGDDVAIRIANYNEKSVYWIRCLAECDRDEFAFMMKQYDIHFERGVFSKHEAIVHKDPLTIQINIDFNSVLLSIPDPKVRDFLIIKTLSKGIE